MEAGQRDELELVAHRADVALERGDLLRRQLLAPVEARRAVVGQHLARELPVDRVGEPLGLARGSARWSPTTAGRHRARRPGCGRSRSPRRRPAGCGRSPPAVRSPEMNGRSRSSTSVVSNCAECASVRHSSTVGTPSTSAASRAAFSVRMCCADRHQHLAAEMAALLLATRAGPRNARRRRRPRSSPHQLVGVQRAAEPGLGVGDDRRHPVGAVVALQRARSGRSGAARC